MLSITQPVSIAWSTLTGTPQSVFAIAGCIAVPYGLPGCFVLSHEGFIRKRGRL